MLSLPVFVIGMFFMHMPYGNWIMLGFTLPVLLVFGRDFFINAWRQLKHGHANMDTLVAVSTGVALPYGPPIGRTGDWKLIFIMKRQQ